MAAVSDENVIRSQFDFGIGGLATEHQAASILDLYHRQGRGHGIQNNRNGNGYIIVRQRDLFMS